MTGRSTEEKRALSIPVCSASVPQTLQTNGRP
jgi:hypothetical protein